MATTRLNWPLLANRYDKPSSPRCRRPVYRRAGFEALEQRRLLSAVPQIDDLGDVEVTAGSSLQIALSATDDDSDSFSYSATVDNANVTGGEVSTFIPEGNRSMRMTVEDFGTMTFELFEQRVPDATSELIDRVDADVFDNQPIHRVGTLADGSPFMFQGGGSGTGQTFDDQFHDDLRHTSTGVLVMANRGSDTNDAQIYVAGGNIEFLDHRYTVVGFLTDGENVRQQIQSVDTELQDPNDPSSENSKPVEDITIDLVEIFVDMVHGTITLVAPQGASGEAEITVTVTDSDGNTDEETFTVTIVAPASNYNPPPYVHSIDDVHTVAGGEANFQIPASDANGDPISYDGVVINDDSDIGLTIDPDTGEVRVSPTADAAGVYGIHLGVRDDVARENPWDTQSVPVFVHPLAPTAVALLASSDTGGDQGDGLTNINNDGEPLKFRVSGTTPGAEVTLLADGVVIGQAVAVTDNLVVTADGTTKLDDGPHTITAYQTLVDQNINVGNSQGTIDLESGESPALAIRVDTGAPQFTNQPTLGAAQGIQYVYDAQTDTETAGEDVEYTFTLSPAGMLINNATGHITWTPQAGQGPTQDVILVAEDAAGNRTELPFTIEINQAPVLDPIGDRDVDELAVVTFTATATDDGGSVTYGLGDGAPQGAAIDPESGVFTWTPSEAQGPGQYEIRVEAVDGTGLVDSETITVRVREVNVPPSFLPALVELDLDEGELLDFVPSAFDADQPHNDLVFSLLGDVPDGLNLDPETNHLTWRPNEQQGGDVYPIHLRVTDSAGASDDLGVNIAVHEVDQPPAIAVPQQFVLPGGTVSVSVEAADPDTPTNPLRFTLEGDVPAGMAIDEATGEITWDVPEDFEPGQVAVTVRATEQPGAGDGLSSAADAVIQVVDPRVLILEAALGQVEFDFPDIGGAQLATPTDPLFAQSPLADRGAAATTGGTRALLPSLTLEDTGMFGTQIGPFTPSGSNGTPLVDGQPGSAAEGDATGEEDAGGHDTRDGRPDDRGARSNRSAGAAPRATDAVLSEVLDDEFFEAAG